MTASRRAALAAVLLPLCAARCGREPEGGSRLRHVPLSTPVYRARVLFVGESADSPIAAVAHFSAGGAGHRVGHRVHVWLGRGSGWRSIAVEEWRDAPLRDTSMILPHGRIRLMLGDDGRIESIAARGDSTDLRFDVDDSIRAWDAGDAARLGLYAARLVLDDRAYDGALLFAHDVLVDTAAAASAGAAEALLAEGGGRYIVVVQRGDDGPFTLEAEARHRATEGTRAARTLAAGTPLHLSPTGASTWRLGAAGDTTTGALGPPGSGWIGHGAQPGYGRFVGVRGTVTIDGIRHAVAGVVASREE